MAMLKRILKIIFISLLSLIIAFNIYGFISIKILKNELVTLFGYSYLEVISGSMEPTISIGDIIIIDTKDNDYKVNDIVTFKDVNGSFVTHKIVDKTDKGFITKGDANNTIDQDYIASKDIIGTYRFKFSHFGVIIASFKNPITLLAILIIGIIVCILKNTDKDGMPLDISEDFKEFLDYKEKQKNEVKEAKPTTKKTTTNKKFEEKKTTTKKTTTKKQIAQKSTNNKTLQKKTEIKKSTENKTKKKTRNSKKK